MKYLILSILISVSVFAQTEENKSFVSFTTQYIPELDERVLTRRNLGRKRAKRILSCK